MTIPPGSTGASAYPLEWPDGWPRTPERQRKTSSPFVTTFDKARRELQSELIRMGAEHVVISSWLPLRQDGNPRSDFARYKIDDPGVAVYFEWKGKGFVMARDVYWSVHDNLRSIGLAVRYMRGMERHGGAHMMERMFSGFQALPVPGSVGWRHVLGDHKTLDDAEQRYRAMAKVAHADGGGSHDTMVRLNLAIEEARAFFKQRAA